MPDIDCKLTTEDFRALKQELLNERNKLQDITDKEKGMTTSISYTEVECRICGRRYRINDLHNCMDGIVTRVERIEGLLGLTPLKRGDE